jgi:choline dehydrogenase-like flavoprotein
VIGGGSSVNGMVYVRGQADDYDAWAQMGNRGWSFDQVLPVFRALEANTRLSNDFHGADGPMTVSDRGYGHPLSWAFVRAAQEAGIPYNEDFNGARQEGVGFYQCTIRGGRRWSAAMAFLRAAEGRANLKILTDRRVARVTFEGRRASGIEMEDGASFRARGEVALCAGAIETPRLMQLSGVGEPGHLKGHGIAVVHDLPGVGENYHDHFESTVQAETIDPISIFRHDKGLTAARHMLQYLLTRTGLLTSNVVETGAFVDVSGTGLPDVQFHVLPVLIGWIDRPPIEAHGITVGPCILRPKSRGSVKLRSADPKDPALFDAGGMTDPDDVATLARGVELGIRILEAPSLARLVKRRALPEPGIENDREALHDYVRSTAKTVFHPCGTAKMGPAEQRASVVGQDLKVHGLDGIRVCDASVMPRLTSGNTNAPTMMIAERASRFMRGLETPA